MSARYHLPPIKEFLSLSFKCELTDPPKIPEYLHLTIHYIEGRTVPKAHQKPDNHEDGLSVIKIGRTATIESSDILLDFSEKKIPVEFEFER